MDGRELTKSRTEEDALWQFASRRLVVWSAKTHNLNAADAEDIVQEAIQQFIGAGGTADPADAEGLLRAVGSRINGIAVNKRRKKADHAVGLTDDGDPAELDDPTDQEERLVDAAFVRKAFDLLLERVEGDDLISSMVMQMADGVEDPAELANVLGRKVHDVYNARRRLKAHVDAVKKITEGW